MIPNREMTEKMKFLSRAITTSQNEAEERYFIERYRRAAYEAGIDENEALEMHAAHSLPFMAGILKRARS